MTYRIRFTPEARADIERLYAFMAARDRQSAARALQIIGRAWSFLEEFPCSCRKANEDHPLLRELIIPFGPAGYVALFEIEDTRTVTVLAARHQREDDYP